MSKTKLRGVKALAVTLLLGAAAGAFLMLEPPKLLAKSETPEFCASCHVMEAQHEAWFHQGAHRRKACVECHLPYDSVANHYLWKSIDGMKDVAVFYSGTAPETISISEHGQQVVKANCLRCHENAVEMISTDRKCWECHRRLSHKRSGMVQTQ
jgi:cytochrome c nitrite reductase small subunit